jgi:catechol 2,3-dioxygenase-like lactoylglutathione lyase family enzyme
MGGMTMATTTETPLQAKTLSTSLTVDDLQRSIRFFEGLGFGEDERWEENGALLGVMLRAGDVTIGLSQDDWKKGRDRNKGIGMRLFISTTQKQTVDEIAARARDAGLRLNSEPHDTEEKYRAFEVTDPSGFLLTISSEQPG